MQTLKIGELTIEQVAGSHRKFELSNSEIQTPDGKPLVSIKVELFKFHKRAEIITFFIHANYRRKGYGTYFYEILLNWLRENGIAEVVLFPNPHAVRFWKSRGFKFSGINQMSVII